jgi:8-oxo-dGTP pyrophosphatase MutT (NUDIX family)
VRARFFHDGQAAPPPNQPRSLGAVALIECEGEVLVERRSDCGLWGFFGGAVEEGESVLQALERELREETGQKFPAPEFFGLFTTPGRIAAYPDGNVRRFATAVFRVRVPQKPALTLSDESLAFAWRSWDELREDDLVATHWVILRAVRAGETLHID